MITEPTTATEEQVDTGTEETADSTTETTSTTTTDAAASDKPADAESKPAEGAPEKYEAFKLPEGYETIQPLVDSYVEQAKSLNLTQEGAQSLVDWYIKTEQKKHEIWAEESKKAYQPEQLDRARAAMRTFGDDKLAAFLEATGAGDHAAVIGLFVKLADKLGDDNLTDGAAQGAAGNKLDEIYPTTAGK